MDTRTLYIKVALTSSEGLLEDDGLVEDVCATIADLAKDIIEDTGNLGGFDVSVKFAGLSKAYDTEVDLVMDYYDMLDEYGEAVRQQMVQHDTQVTGAHGASGQNIVIFH